MKTKRIFVEFEFDAELDEAMAFEHIQLRMDGWEYGVSTRMDPYAARDEREQKIHDRAYEEGVRVGMEIGK